MEKILLSSRTRALVLLIGFFSFAMRGVLDVALMMTSRAVLGHLLVGTLVVVSLWIALRMRRSCRLLRSPGVCIPLGAALSLFFLLSLPEERTHIPLYGLLGFFLVRDMRSHAHGLLLAVCIGSLVGVIDEAIQWLLPWRVGDIRDIGINTFSVVSGALVGHALTNGEMRDSQ